nr:phage/plasmid primase, P4 family [Aliiruegeria lutimaris]
MPERADQPRRFTPADSADCPTFLKFLQEAHAGQEDVIAYLQKYGGLCLTGQMNEETVHFFYGGGGNGKGVFIKAIGYALGDYQVTAQESAFTIDRSGRRAHAQEIAVLRGKRHVVVSEPEEGRAWDMGRVKAWSGNEAPMRANFMRQDSFEFWPAGKLTMVANEKLTIKTVDAATRRRLRMVPWPNTPDSPDSTLKDRLHEEAPGILRWMLDGLAFYLRDGMGDLPPSIAAETEAYLAEQDVIQRFMDDCLVFTDVQNDISLTTIRTIYNEWALGNDASQINRGLGTKLTSKGARISSTGGRKFLRGAYLSAAGEVLKEDATKRAEESN